ncbi:MAG: AAA family ATPase [Thermodesulfobacteriota bacterium]
MSLIDDLLGDVLRESASEGETRQHATSQAPMSRAVVRRMLDVAPENLAWLWQYRLARGKLALLAGEPGVGKSTLAQAIAAAVSVGAALPGDVARAPADVVLLSAEESAADTIRPRLERMGADLTRVHVLDGVTDDLGVRPLALADADDLAVLEGVIADHRAALVVIDVLQAYLGAGVDMHRANEVRAVLAPLAALAERTGAAILVICHTNKSSSASVTSRVMGSVDIVAAVRCVLLAGHDPEAADDSTRGVVARGKANVPGQPPAIAYELREGALLWGDERPEVTAERLLAPRAAPSDDDRSALSEAIDYLRAELADGERDAGEVQRAAERAGISERTLRRARTSLRVRAARRGYGRGGRWVWALPPIGGQTAIDGHSQSVAAYGEAGHLCGPGGTDDALELTCGEDGA